jgi:hypothetical protein
LDSGEIGGEFEDGFEGKVGVEGTMSRLSRIFCSIISIISELTLAAEV